MPQKIICKGCGKVLLTDVKLRPPEEVIKELEGHCPYCGKALVFDPDKIEINIIENKDTG
jgi:ribosomal protein S27E